MLWGQAQCCCQPRQWALAERALQTEHFHSAHAELRYLGRKTLAYHSFVLLQQAFWSSGEQLGQLLLSLRYTPADGQLWIGVLRASGVRAAGKHCDCNETIARYSNLAPYVTVWLLREKEKPEKRSTPKPSGDSRRFSIAPVFDEAFFFEIAPSELSTSNVVVSVINHQLIFKVTPLLR